MAQGICTHENDHYCILEGEISLQIGGEWLVATVGMEGDAGRFGAEVEAVEQ